MSGDQAEIYVSDMPAPADTSAEAFDRIEAKVYDRALRADREQTPAERDARVAQARRMFMRDVERVALAVLPHIDGSISAYGVVATAFDTAEDFVKAALRRRGIAPEIIKEVTR